MKKLFKKIIVVGSGIAGLNFSLRATEQGFKVILITKKKIAESSTNYAQGGIAAVLEKTDDFQKHVKDTLKAGAYHNDKRAVEFMVRHGPSAIKRLIELGVPFATHHGKILLTKEGGHSERRIAFVGDYTGREIERILVKKARKNPNIVILEHTFVIDILVKRGICYGVSVFLNGKIKNLFASAVVLATGGLGQIFKITTNPEISTADGYAMACRAGCAFKDMEFIQFHPTTFMSKSGKVFLLSEALRGEGAYLRNHRLKRFVNELANRDIAARKIFKELKHGPVYLDLRHKNPAEIKTRFPQIYQTLKKYGFDIIKDLIPVMPAAHYSCGGIKTDLHGRTKIKNLFAFGEAAWTGVHGANRLASNSLLEATVFSDQVLKSAGDSAGDGSLQNKENKTKWTVHPDRQPVDSRKLQKIEQTLKNTMWKYCGIIREERGLKKAREIIEELILNSCFHGNNTHDGGAFFNQKLWEVKNMLQTSLLVVDAAGKRKKSLGCHFRLF